MGVDEGDASCAAKMIRRDNIKECGMVVNLSIRTVASKRIDY
jgi:hypothetical protein